MRTNLRKYNLRHWEIKKLSIIAVIVLIFVYILHSLISGDRGFLSLFDLSEKHDKLQEEILKLQKQKQSLEKKVYSLKSESMDLDLLEEQTRKNLGYSKKGEKVYID